MILAKVLRWRDTLKAVAPGPVATPMFLEGKDPALVDRIADSRPPVCHERREEREVMT
jgi:3-oxoacyl-[acyl-carrier protein] reductase